jgi:SAM-dependent methyltransferase
LPSLVHYRIPEHIPRDMEKSMEITDPISVFGAKVAESLGNQTFVRLVLSRPVLPAATAERITGRLVEIRAQPCLSLTLRHAAKDITKNLPVSEAGQWLGAELGAHYRSALLNTTTRDWQLSLESATEGKVVSHKPAFKEAPTRSHDKPKQSFLDAGAQDWLQALDVVEASGKVRASMADKHRQIHHYLEIFSHLARDCGWSSNKRWQELVLADMGCGKGYLTFALWHVLERVWKRPARIIGVETQLELVQKTSAIADSIGARNLSFVQGSIQSAPLPKLDALIALHACNTGTDDAIRRGIELNAQLIVVAPCCHKELRPQFGKPEPLAPVLRHGVMEERMSEWVTDGLRALFLEWAGYETKVFEFVSSEHTPKNLMISAIRKTTPFASAAAKERIVALKSFFGIQHHSLDPLLELQPAKAP